MRIFKKITRLFIYSIAVFTAIVLITFGMLNVSYIQTKATNFIAKNLAETIDMQVKVERVSFSLWNKIVLKNVQILDTENQTIVESENFFLLIHSVSYSKKQLHFEKLILANTNIHIEKNMQGVWNIQSLFSSKETNTPWDIAIFSIEILNSTFSLLDKQTYEKNDFGINYSDIEITDFSIVASNLHFFESTIMADIQGLSGKEKSGFILKTLSTELRVDSTQMNFKNVQLHTPFSHIITQELNFAYNSFQDFSEFIHAVKIQSTFQHSKLQLADISYFAPTLQLSPYAFQFSGNFTGRIADFKTKNLHIEYGEKSQFYGDIEMMGLPTISETFIHVHTKRFSTNSTDIVNIRIPPYTENKYIKVPQILHDINEFSYTGNITGFVKDMVAYGTFTTPAGVIHSDVSIKESAFKPNELVFSGDVSFSQFDLQKIAKGTHNWGKTSLVVKVKGDMANGKFNKAFVRGDMANIEFKGYNYKNVSIDGLVSNKRFDGQLEILDTNVTVNFSGLFDYSLEVPEFNFHANLAHANLHALGFVDDSISNISMDTHVDFIGLSLDNLKGEIIINSGVFENSHGTYKSQQFTIDVDNVGEHRNIQINSDLFDVTVAGKGSYQELQDYIYDFLHAHIPSIPKRKNYAPHTHLPHFNLSVHIKKADSLLHIFNPNIHIAQGSYMNSVFSEEQQLCMMESFVPELSIGNVKLQNIKITAEGSTEQINTNLIYSLALNQLTIPDISSSFMFKNNSFEHATHWNHVDSVVYKGSIENSGIFEPSTHAFLPKIVVSVPHQTVVIADSVWHIHIAESTIDSSSIYVSHAYVQKHDEKIEFQGKISHNKNDTISIMFQDFDAENFNNIMPENINFSGVLQGKINFQRLYETPLIFANISSDDFYFNGNKQGVLKIRSMWMPQKRGIKLSISCTKGTTDILSLRGTFDPTSKDMNFTLGLKNYLLSDFSEIFKNTVDNMAGYIDADVSLQGNIQNPTLTGKAEVKRGKFRVIATQTPYNIKGTLNTEGSQFVLSDIALTDTLGNSAHTSGYIDIKNIKNPQYLIALETKKLFALNTNKYDNQFFYGQAFFDGNATIKGDLEHTKITIVGKTLENTICNIPLSYSELEESRDFLFFGDAEKNTTTISADTKQETSTEISLNLQVTPHALAQIIFDEKVGDIIRVRGNANLQINLNELGELSINGLYIIDEGDYLFTLKSLINKKFIIQRGGKIQWTGDPLDAQIDVLADYKLKASPKPLMSSFDKADSYANRINVTCRIHLEQELTKPTISYDILLPGTTGTLSEVVHNFSDDEKNIHFISLLLANSFMKDQSLTPSGSEGINSSSFEAVTAQMNHILSQIDKDVDVGLNYRPGTEFTSNELELALSTQILNNRVLINLNGYTEFGQTNEQHAETNDFTGDISIEIKLNEEGNLRLKGFSRSNNDPLNEREGNTHGAGIFYSREFNYLRELFQKKTKE